MGWMNLENNQKENNMKNKAIYVIIIWVLCVIFNWCALWGDWKGNFPENVGRENSGIIAAFSMLGPITTVATPFMTNFYQYGFRLK
jgi:flagellar basal body-associated protein FliL